VYRNTNTRCQKIQLHTSAHWAPKLRRHVLYPTGGRQSVAGYVARVARCHLPNGVMAWTERGTVARIAEGPTAGDSQRCRCRADQGPMRRIVEDAETIRCFGGRVQA